MQFLHNSPLFFFFLFVYKKAHPLPNSSSGIPPISQSSVLAISHSLFMDGRNQEKMNRNGDWNCRLCKHHNFQRRDSCRRCGDPKLFGDYTSGFNNGRSAAGGSFSFTGSEVRPGDSFGFTGSDVRPGDWYCTVGNCGTHNFANRSTCFTCGTFKDDSSGGCMFDFSRAYGSGGSGGGSGGGGGGGSGRSGWKSGDWICTMFGCNEHNFANRMECFRCSAPRDSANRLYWG